MCICLFVFSNLFIVRKRRKLSLLLLVVSIFRFLLIWMVEGRLLVAPAEVEERKEFICFGFLAYFV
jgi:hypothetical protein